MKVVVQVVSDAYVSFENESHKIERGYVLFVGLEKGDNEEIISKMASKILKLRILRDEDGKTNLSITDIKGELLSVSQFTLPANYKNRNRPDFSNSLNKEEAFILYNKFNDYLRESGLKVETGFFGFHMKLTQTNIGPFTVVLTNNEL